MTREEYLQRAQEQDDWAPGWEAVEAPFAALYPGQTPTHMATDLVTRAVLGGNQYLDGASVYASPGGYQHVVSFGMSTLYAGADSDAYGGEYSGWGYEMTAKVVGPAAADAIFTIDTMGHLARYTYTSKRWFEPYQTVAGNGEPIKKGAESLLTALLVVPDTEVGGVDSVHGRLDFLQLVGITEAELTWVTEDPTVALARGRELADRMVASGNRLLVTDLGRASVI